MKISNFDEYKGRPRNKSGESKNYEIPYITPLITYRSPLMPSPRQLLGRRGEAAARIFLERRGYEILAQNYHAYGGEIDIIAREPQSRGYVLVEVKTRTNTAYGRAEESITRNKIRSMMCAASRYFYTELRLSEIPPYEIHAITVTVKGDKYRIEHFQNVGYEWQ